MPLRSCLVTLAALAFISAGLTAQPRYFPVDEIRPGMQGIGRTVFEGDRLDEFRVHVLGVLRNVVGPQRNLILARLEGGPLARTGVIAGMSGSPVYIDGRLVGAVAYSLGEFSTEPIAGITPIGEMIAATDATTVPPRRVAAAAPIVATQEMLLAALRQTLTGLRPFASSPADVQANGPAIDPGLGVRLRPIATPLSIRGFDPSAIAPLLATLHDGGFISPSAVTRRAGDAPVSGQAPALAAAEDTRESPLRPGDSLGVSLMTGDLEMGATGTVTAVEGSRVYAFGHPFYGLGPTRFPMTRASVITVVPSLQNSTKLANTGAIIGTVQQDRSTGIAGTLGPGPALIPVTLTLNSDRRPTTTFRVSVVKDQTFTPLLAYLAISNTLTSYERQNGAASYAVRGSATVRGYGALAFEDLFSGDQPLAAASAAVMSPINFLLQNSIADVDVEAITLTIDAREEPRSATLERAWIDAARIKAGDTVDLTVLLRTYRGEPVTRSLPIHIPDNAQGAISIMVADAARLSQWEARELQTQPQSSRDVPQMLRVLNDTRRNNRLYVRLVRREAGAVVRGEPLAALPPSVLTVMQGDRDAGAVRPLQAALGGAWEIPADYAVTGARTLTIPIE